MRWNRAMVLASAGAVALPALAQDDVTRLRDTDTCPGCRIENADFSGDQFLSTDLSGARIRDSDFGGADLFLARALLDRASFRDANLKGASFEGASFVDVDLRGADLTGGRLPSSDADGTSLDGATICNTTMPDGTNPHGGMRPAVSCPASGGSLNARRLMAGVVETTSVP